MQKLLFTAIAALIFFGACKKVEPPTGFDEPIFMVTYQDSLPVTVTAGLDGIYHFTKYEKSGDDFFYSTNTFADANCPNGDCPGSLSFEFFHRNVADSAFFGGMYRYMLPDSLSQVPVDYYTFFTWGSSFPTFPEQTFSLSTPNPVVLSNPVTGSLFVLPNEPVGVALECNGNNGLYSHISRTFQLNDLSAYPGVSIEAFKVGAGYNLTAKLDPSGSPASIYQWNTGDTSATIFVDSTSFLFEYQVSVTNASGKMAHAQLANLPFPPALYISSPQVTATVAPVSPVKFLKVAIQWVDSAGTIWRSDRGRQYSPQNTFEVLESEEYLPNEFGDTVRKLKIRFNCLLYTVDGQSRNFTGEGIIALARP